jgi:ABC-type transport system substrate-binding protein
MFVKRILIYFPLALILFLVQSVFWVPTYDKQAVGNPKRLVKFLEASGGDAAILNPILSADSSSAAVNEKVFEGLIDFDNDLKLRPRLAQSWIQFEEAYLTVNPSRRPPGYSGGELAREWAQFLLQSLRARRGWYSNIRRVEVLPEEEVTGTVALPVLGEDGRPVKNNGVVKTLDVAYRLKRPPRIKFTLKKVDQDFFTPIKHLIGQGYFSTIPYARHIEAVDPAHAERLRAAHARILPLTEHNPVILFTLREGVLFHDGHEFDASDVKFTYDSIMNPRNASPRTSDYEPVKALEVVGPYRVRIVYKRLFSPAINSWTMGILPEHLLNARRLREEAVAAGRRGDEPFTLRDTAFNRRPVGTGPFVFGEWKSDEMIRLTRNDAYWGAPPEYEEYVIRIIPDTLTREMEFYACAVDQYGAEPHQVARLKSDPKYHSISSVGTSYSYIGYNLRNPLFQSARVRTALGMAIDVEQIIRYVLYGEGERVSGPYAKITDWYDPEVPLVPYDPAAALKLLEEEGWRKNAEGYLEKEGRVFEFNLITNSGNPTRKNILTIVQNSWRKIGIKCNTRMFEWAVFLKDFVNTMKFDAVVLGWSMGFDPDLYQIWHSSQAGPNQLNFVGYDNPQADRLIVRIRQEYDRKKQVKLAHELHRIIARDQPYTFLFVSRATRLLDRKIVIVERQADGSEKYVKVYPTRDGSLSYYFNKLRKLETVPQFTPAAG